jgi:hypothetical protein
MSRDVHSCTHWLRPRNPPPPSPIPPVYDAYTRALLVSKDRRHLFVTPRSEYSLISFNVCCTFQHWPMCFFQFFPHLLLENCKNYFPQVVELYCLPAFWPFLKISSDVIRLWSLFIKVLQNTKHFLFLFSNFQAMPSFIVQKTPTFFLLKTSI